MKHGKSDEERKKHNEIDQLLSERFGEHTIRPEKELWDKIESRMEPRVVSFSKYSRLKIALIGSAAVIGGLVFLLFVLKNQKPTMNEYSEFKSTERTVPQEKSQLKNKSSEIPENSIAMKNIPEKNQNSYTEKDPIQNQQWKNPEVILKENEKVESENNRISPQQIKSLTTENTLFRNPSQPENLKVVGAFDKKIPEKPSSKTIRNKKNHYNYHSKTRHISAKKYFTQKTGNKGLIKAGKFFNDFDLKVNLSPAYSMRTVNNLQNISVMEYDQAFYNRTESGKISLNGGLELAYKINTGWSIYSGIKFSQYSQQIQNAQNNYKITSSSSVIIPSSAGNISIDGEGIGELSTQSQFETKLKMQFLDIPLIARHYFSPNFYVDAGIKYSYLLADKTSVSLNDTSVNFSVEKINGLNKHNFGLVLGTGIEQVTHSGIRFEIGPEINLNMNNLNPSAKIISRPLSFGIHAGIFLGRYRQM